MIKDVKTVISVDDALMAQADEAARDLGLSRRGLVTVNKADLEERLSSIRR
ncbi:MAG: hypothetical protein JST93_34400 [Acidobacteria bacterium]|nr:hypothetical protein [Acidobacteriota bacterium]